MATIVRVTAIADPRASQLRSGCRRLRRVVEHHRDGDDEIAPARAATAPTFHQVTAARSTRSFGHRVGEGAAGDEQQEPQPHREGEHGGHERRATVLPRAHGRSRRIP